jgi:hypothetical protein
LARADDDPLVSSGGRRVALIGHAEQLVVEAQGVHDLGRRRQERDDPHRSILRGAATIEIREDRKHRAVVVGCSSRPSFEKTARASRSATERLDRPSASTERTARSRGVRIYRMAAGDEALGCDQIVGLQHGPLNIEGRHRPGLCPFGRHLEEGPSGQPEFRWRLDRFDRLDVAGARRDPNRGNLVAARP